MSVSTVSRWRCSKSNGLRPRALCRSVFILCSSCIECIFLNAGPRGEKLGFQRRSINSVNAVHTFHFPPKLRISRFHAFNCAQETIQTVIAVYRADAFPDCCAPAQRERYRVLRASQFLIRSLASSTGRVNECEHRIRALCADYIFCCRGIWMSAHANCLRTSAI